MTAITFLPFEPGHSIYWIPASTQRRAELPQLHPGIVLWTKGAHATIRLADGRQRVVSVKRLTYAVHCPQCEVPGIVENGYQVCPLCGEQTTEPLTPELIKRWFNRYHTSLSFKVLVIVKGLARNYTDLICLAWQYERGEITV